MKLSYKTEFPWGEPTDFKKKILASQGLGYTDFNGDTWPADPNTVPKIHTFRTDESNRWPPMTKKIHHTLFNRQPNEDIFLVTECTGVQEAIITYTPKQILIYIDTHLYIAYPRLRDSSSVHYENIVRMNELARNDGFESPEQFFKWFSEDWSGKIIHWTDKKYSA